MKSAISVLSLQPKLLRALQEQEFERLGSTKTLRVDVRLIAATHRDLQSMIRNNQFREDLFYRLNVFPIEIPPLRERREDIPLLVHYFVLRHSRQMQKRVKSVPEAGYGDAGEFRLAGEYPGTGELHRALRDLNARGRIECPANRVETTICEVRYSSRAQFRTG